MKLTNGGTATAYNHCGDMDLCARLTYPNGDVLSSTPKAQRCVSRTICISFCRMQAV